MESRFTRFEIDMWYVRTRTKMIAARVDGGIRQQMVKDNMACVFSKAASALHTFNLPMSMFDELIDQGVAGVLDAVFTYDTETMPDPDSVVQAAISKAVMNHAKQAVLKAEFEKGVQEFLFPGEVLDCNECLCEPFDEDGRLVRITSRVDKALDMLSLEERRIIIFVNYEEKMTAEDIAGFFGIRSEEVSERYNAALVALKNAYDAVPAHAASNPGPNR